MSQNNNENSESYLPEVPGNPEPRELDMQFRAELHSGPLPPPDVLERYERIQKDTLNRLLTMAEKDQDAKIAHNNKAVEYKFKVLALHEQNDRSDNSFSHKGQTFGFATVFTFFVILGMTVWLDNTTMFVALFCAGAFAGLAQLIRSYQRKNGGAS